MRKSIFITMYVCLLLLQGCAVNKKYVEITVEKDAALTITGNVDPQFMRTNTDETQDVTTDAKGEVPMISKCNSCHDQLIAMGSAPPWDSWFKKDPETKPEPPPEVVPPPKPPVVPPPVVPPAGVTKEYGEKKVYSNEVNYHFDRPIAFYKKFRLIIGDEIFVVSMSYKSHIEVRNSETDGNMVVIAPVKYKDTQAHIVYPVTDQPTLPPPTPPITPGLSTHYDHWRATATAWNGPALILCRDSPKFRECLFNGEPMKLHGIDEGRWVWAQYTKPGRGGIIVCDGTTRFEVIGGKNRQDGDCRR